MTAIIEILAQLLRLIPSDWLDREMNRRASNRMEENDNAIDEFIKTRTRPAFMPLSYRGVRSPEPTQDPINGERGPTDGQG